MLIPTKHELLSTTLLAVGAILLNKLKAEPKDIESLYQLVKKDIDINLELYFDCITFLWLSNFILLEDFVVKRVR